MRYHISPTTGRANKCFATTRPCPVGGAHYDSKEEAQAAYEASKNSFGSGMRKAGETYDRYDRPLHGTGTGSGGREATLQRSIEKPSLSYDEVETDRGWDKVISANGVEAFRVKTWDEVARAEHAREIGEWVELKNLMEEDSSTCETLDDLLRYQGEDLAETVKDLEEDRARVTFHQTVKGMEKYDRDLRTYRLALKLWENDAKTGRRVVVSPETVKTQIFKIPGEAAYEEVTSPDGAVLGTVTYREGFYLAGVHNGRAPYSVGQHETRVEALEALIANNGRGQKQG